MFPYSLSDLIHSGWQSAYSELFDEPDKPFVSRLADHHAEAIEWHWNSRLAFINGGKPEFWAYFPIWSRSKLIKRAAGVK